MLKLHFYESIRQKWALYYAKNILHNNLKQVSLFSHIPFPAEADKKQFVNNKRPNFRTFKDNQGFSGPNVPRIREKPLDDSMKSFKNESEQEFLVSIKNDPDTFGGPIEPEIIDEGDVREEKYFAEQPVPKMKLRTKQYADLIKDYIKQHKLKEAIDVLEVKMLKEDRVKPENYIFNLLLGACGRVGYTKKAFMLYNKMKQRGLKVTGGTYTALFNACANSPWPTDGLTRAQHLHEVMIEKGDQPNDTNYNAMIKAFGRCGDLPMAFKLVDEMAQNRFHIKDDTVNFLLQACISDKEAGFRHALLVWRKIVKRNIKPTVYTFNLLLRCTRDCGLGDLKTTEDVIAKLVGETNSLIKQQSPEVLQLEKGQVKHKHLSETGHEILSDLPDNSEMYKPEIPINQRPNLLAPKPHLGSILSLSEIKNPEDRLLLLGGCQGFLETMADYKCTPDIKTFSQLLDSIPSTNAAEKQLVVAMKKLDVKPDINFYNMLIKKKSMRCDYEGAKEVVITMKQMKFRPNLLTYGVLAIGCKTKEEALDLVKEMQLASYRLNSAILGAMMHQACYHREYSYIFEIMELCLREQVPVNKKFLQHLDEFKNKMRTLWADKQLKNSEERLFGVFRARYKIWLTEIQIDETETAHPWQQYRQVYPEDKNVKYKGKDTARFKPKRQSLFKVKTSEKYRH